MPWRDSSPMDLKTQFIADYLRQTLSVAELCYHYNISRKTGYKWIDRYLEEGAAGLADRSRRPHHYPRTFCYLSPRPFNFGITVSLFRAANAPSCKRWAGACRFFNEDESVEISD